MQQLINVWSALEPGRRLFVIAATIAVFGAVLLLSRMAASPTLTLLYAGLEGGTAGEVVTALEQSGVAYEVRGDSIFVEASKRDALRMKLATEGLPANSSRGYELLDSLSGFGTTAQMFDAAYLRAKEGELARTIMASPHVRQARVHIADAGGNPFQRDIEPSASVTITPSQGGISSSHAKALTYLVASAVAGLRPENVAIIDAGGNLVGAAEDQAQGPISEEKALSLKKSVQRLLEARVGFGNAVVEVSVDTVNEAESIVERRFDPASRVAISTDTEERTTSSQDSGGAGVTVASNLPEGDGGSGDSSSSQNSETRERINYEVSETQREITRAPGDIKRLTVAVLVNGTEQIGEDGEPVLVARTEEELETLRELVASAVGFQEERGDVITIKSMQFEPIASVGTSAEPGLLQQLSLDVMSLIQMAVLAVVALVLGLFVIRPIFSASPDPADETPLIGAAPAAQPVGEALTGEIEFDDGSTAEIRTAGAAELSENADLPVTSQLPSDPVERLRALIGERQDETVEILRSWMEDKEESA